MRDKMVEFILSLKIRKGKAMLFARHAKLREGLEKFIP